MILDPFAPGATVNIAATTTSSTVTLNPDSTSVRVANSGTVTVFVAFGSAGVSATTSSMPVFAGTVETFKKASSTTVAAITASGTATVYFTSGEGS